MPGVGGWAVEKLPDENDGEAKLRMKGDYKTRQNPSVRIKSK
jgi:hypothetical protein